MWVQQGAGQDACWATPPIGGNAFSRYRGSHPPCRLPARRSDSLGMSMEWAVCLGYGALDKVMPVQCLWQRAR